MSMTTPTIAEQIAALKYLYDARHGPHMCNCLRATLAMLQQQVRDRQAYGYCIDCGSRPCICEAWNTNTGQQHTPKPVVKIGGRRA